MANASYTTFRDGIMKGEIDLDTAVFKVVLVRGYTFNGTHTYLSDVTGNGGTINGTSPALTNKTVTGGVFDADDTTIAATASALPHALIVFQASAVTGGADIAATGQRLCFYLDTGSNLPMAPAAGTVTITWPNTAGKIYQVGS